MQQLNSSVERFPRSSVVPTRVLLVSPPFLWQPAHLAQVRLQLVLPVAIMVLKPVWVLQQRIVPEMENGKLKQA